MSVATVHGEITICGRPARNQVEAIQAIVRTGAQASNPKPVDIENGIWNMDVPQIVLHHLAVDGEYVRQGMGAKVTIPGWEE